MFLELRIGNLALAEDVVLRPGPYLTVLTGETGAGKSLVAGALALLTGGRVDRGLVRRGEELAWVEAVCDLSGRVDLLADARRLGLVLAADGLLVLRRELRREGRGRVLINGAVSSLAVLERIGRRLFAIQSQNQQRELSEAGFARELLDAVLGLADRRDAVDEALAAYQTACGDLDDHERTMELAAQQLDMWRYQHEELGAADLREGEERELGEAIAIKRHARAMQDAAAGARDRLGSGPQPVRESLGSAIAGLLPHADRSERLASALAQLESAAALLDEADSELDRFLDNLQLDPRGLDELEERKALYESLRRKYRHDVPGLLALHEQLGERLGRQDRAADDLEKLRAARESARCDLETACVELHDARESGAPTVAAEAEGVIRPLALPKLDVSLAVEPRRDPDGEIVVAGVRCRAAAHGADTVRLLVRTNPGEDMGEASTIASGGEASRIHLGLTLLVRGAARPLLQVFDEVDAGLGMDAATPVAMLLRQLARQAQAICITHLPTVAVYGQDHWRVTKQVDGGRTTVALQRLGAEERVAEVARQLGGADWRHGDAAAQTAYARELLEATNGSGPGPGRS